MDTQGHDWKSTERKEIFRLGALPAMGALVLVILLFPAMPSLWLPGFLIASLGAYTTSFIGVLPILIWFRRRGWQKPIHFALAGFAGVLLPWWVVGVFVGALPSASFDGSASRISLLAAGIGAAMSLIFGLISARAKTARPDPSA